MQIIEPKSIDGEQRNLCHNNEAPNGFTRHHNDKSTQECQVSDKISYSAKILLVSLSLARLLICLWPQYGYLHPDEFFQSPEEVARKFFNCKTQPVWEFTTDKPIRFMLIPYLLNGSAFKIISLFQEVPSGYWMLVGPRLAYTVLSFSIDFCLFKFVRLLGKSKSSYVGISVIFQTSFVTLTCFTRTLSNLPEVVLFASLLLVICQDLCAYQNVNKDTDNLPTKTKVRNSAVRIGFLLTLGIWNRPTFVLFALVPMLHWTWQTLKMNNMRIARTILEDMIPIALVGLVSALFLCACDTMYYQGSSPILKSIDLMTYLDVRSLIDSLADWTATPLNFALFNSSKANLKQFGLHPWYFAPFVSFPAAFNLLAILFYSSLVDIAMGTSPHPKENKIILTMMSNATIASVVLISPAPHQEFRFLLPLIVPLVLLHANDLYKSRTLFIIWIMVNLGFSCFYTTIHEASVIKAALDLNPIIQSHLTKSQEVPHILHIMARETYLVPTYQWNIPRDDKTVIPNLLGDAPDLIQSFKAIFRSQAEHPGYQIEAYVLLPNIRLPNLMAVMKTYRATNSTVLKTYSPHFGHEWLLESLKYIRRYGGDKWREAFGVSLVKVDI